MGKKMDLINIADKARRKEQRLIGMQRNWDNIAIQHCMESYLEGKETMEVDSCVLAAIVGLNYNPRAAEYRSRARFVYFAMKEILCNPFTCTITRVPGSAEAEYRVENKKAMKPLGKLIYDRNAEFDKKGVELFTFYREGTNLWKTKKRVDHFADELRKLYNEYKDDNAA